MVMVTVLSEPGVSPCFDEALWAAASGLFTLLAVGTGMIPCTLFVGCSVTVELTGSSALVATTIWDWRLQRAQA